MKIDDDNESDQDDDNRIVDDEGDLSMVSSSTQTVTRDIDNGSIRNVSTKELKTAMPPNVCYSKFNYVTTK